jgi:biotin synthase
MSKIELINQLEEKVLAGQDISREEARELGKLSGSDLYYLYAAAGRIRDQQAGCIVDLCSIMNAKSGQCSEDCKYCPQSAHHQTGVDVYGLLGEEAILERARLLEAEGACWFSLVTSGRGINADDLTKILAIFRRLGQETKLKLCASLGTIDAGTARKLKEAGVRRYHHNLESSASYFPSICTTHTYEERIETIKACQSAGLEVCSGGILSMGETMDQRLEMAFALKELGIRSVPLNILNPIEGTALEKQKVISPMEILQTIAIYRFILPKVELRFAGGREKALRNLQALGYLAGINATLVGSYLTASGRTVAEDIQMIQDMGLAAAEIGG